MAAKITENVDKAKHPMAETLETEVLWQAEKLEEARKLIKNASIVIAYDNGGGQTGIRKNPAFEMYFSLFKSFLRGVASLDEMLKDAPPTSAAAKAKLDQLLDSVRRLRLNAAGYSVTYGGED